MPICQRCTSAIAAIYPRPFPSQRVTIELPILAQSDIRNCWVCLKFSTWLESEDPSAFDLWQTCPLKVIFFCQELITPADAGVRDNIPFRLFVGILLDGKDQDEDESCIFELSLVFPKGDINLGRITLLFGLTKTKS